MTNPKPKPKTQEHVAIPVTEYPDLVRMLNDMGFEKKFGPASLMGVGIMYCVRKQHARWASQQARKEKANDEA